MGSFPSSVSHSSNQERLNKLVDVLICVGYSGFLPESTKFKYLSTHFYENHDLELLLKYNSNYSLVKSLYNSTNEMVIVNDSHLYLYKSLMTKNIDILQIPNILYRLITDLNPNLGLIYQLMAYTELSLAKEFTDKVLQIAIKNCYLPLISRAIEMGAESNIKIQDSFLIVHFWKNNFPKIVDCLVRFNANLIPLMIHAIDSDDFNLALQCVDWGIDLNSFANIHEYRNTCNVFEKCNLKGDDKNITLLDYIYIISKKKNIKTKFKWISFLITHGINIDIISPFFDSTLLALISNSADIVFTKFLIENGANIELTDPLYFLLKNKELNYQQLTIIVKLLVENGADVTKTYLENRTCLMHLCEREGTEELIDLFLEKGADINAETTSNHFPICIALLTNNFNIFKHLLKKPRINLNLLNDKGANILTLSCILGKEDFASEILNYDIDANNESFKETSSLILAIKNSFSLNFVKRLIAKGVDVNKVYNSLVYKNMTSFGMCVLVYNDKSSSPSNKKLAQDIADYLINECGSKKITPERFIVWEKL